jgi:hypothetical protein
MSGYSDRFQINDEEQTWGKFKQVNGNWHILITHDPDPQSLERDSSAHHVHYWQQNGNWYIQSKVDGTHTIGRDYLTEQINNTDTNNLSSSQVRELADQYSDVIYGPAGYDSSSNIHGIQVEEDYHEMLNGYIQKYQSSVDSSSQQQLHSLDSNLSENNTSTAASQEVDVNRINWIDDPSNVAAPDVREVNTDRINWINDPSNVAAPDVREVNIDRISWIDNTSTYSETVSSDSDSNNITWAEDNQTANTSEDVNSSESTAEVSTDAGDNSTASAAAESSSSASSSAASV